MEDVIPSNSFVKTFKIVRLKFGRLILFSKIKQLQTGSKIITHQTTVHFVNYIINYFQNRERTNSNLQVLDDKTTCAKLMINLMLVNINNNINQQVGPTLVQCLRSKIRITRAAVLIAQDRNTTHRHTPTKAVWAHLTNWKRTNI